jgi:DNA-binding MarR family transcriptional regulator
MNMQTSQTRSRAGLAAALRVSISRLSRRMRAEGGHSLSATQIAALGAVARHEALTPGELAEREKVQPPSMTRVIAQLEDKGLLTRSPHPTDRRQVILSLTAAGDKLFKEERRRKEAWLAQRLGELTSEERAILRQAAPILERISRG